jgi:hypothetical protein
MSIGRKGMTQKLWRKTIKRDLKRNDLQALALTFSIKANDRWNNDLRRVV